MISQVFPYLFILIICCLQNQVLSSSSPVLLYANVNFPQSAIPLSTISPLNLISDYICQLPNEHIQLRIFAVNDLTNEDIQRGPESNHPLLLNAKHDQTNFHYYPNVGNHVYKTFSLIPQSNNMKCSHIHFEIISSKVYETLSHALNIMKETIDNIENDADNPVLIVLINGPSHHEKSSRQRRQTNDENNQVLISNNNTCMFYAENLYWNNVNGSMVTNQVYTLNLNQSSCKPTPTNINSSVIIDLVWINTNAPFDIVNMRLITTIIDRYWYLENATLNNNEYRYFAYGMRDEMTTPPTYSYVCTTAIFVRFDNLTTSHGKYNFTDKFYITNLQFQPFNGNGLNFGPLNYCTSFFTSGIWMGIMSSLLCLFILLIGIRRMMAIKSNDRFDDPKGKPLIIKAEE